MEQKNFISLYTDLIDTFADDGILIITDTNEIKPSLRKLFKDCEAKQK